MPSSGFEMPRRSTRRRRATRPAPRASPAGRPGSPRRRRRGWSRGCGAPRRGRPPRSRPARRSRRCSPGSRAGRRPLTSATATPSATDSGSVTSSRVTTTPGWAGVRVPRGLDVPHARDHPPPGVGQGDDARAADAATRAGDQGRPRGARRGRLPPVPRTGPAPEKSGIGVSWEIGPASGSGRRSVKCSLPGSEPDRCRRGGPRPGRGRWPGRAPRCVPRATRRRGRSGRRRRLRLAGMPRRCRPPPGSRPARRGPRRRRRGRPRACGAGRCRAG